MSVHRGARGYNIVTPDGIYRVRGDQLQAPGLPSRAIPPKPVAIQSLHQGRDRVDDDVRVQLESKRRYIDQRSTGPNELDL